MKNLSFLFVYIFMTSMAFSQGDAIDSLDWSIDLEDVVVTAQYAPTDSKSAVHRIRTIRQEDIQQRAVTNLEQLLRQELNIRISQDMVLGSSINLQGVSGENVQIMIDGIPLIGRVGNDIDLGQVNLNNIERVEIVEGPLSVNYGTNALGGVINLITKKSQLNTFETNISTKWESLGRKYLNASVGIRPLDKVLVNIHGGASQFDGFTPDVRKDEDDDRTHFWNPKEQAFIGGSVRYDFAEGHQLRYAYDCFSEDVTNLGEIRRPAFKPYAFDDHYHTDRQDHSLLYEGKLNDQYYLKTTLGYNNFDVTRKAVRHEFDTNEETLLANEQDTTGFNAVVFRPVIASKFTDRKLNFQVGVDLRYEDASGVRVNDQNSGKRNFSELGDYAVFGSLQYQANDQLIIQAGARLAHNTKFKSPIVPSVNLKYAATDQITLRASYAKGFRAPSLKELYFYFVDANHSVLGNTNLKAETSDNFQLSLGWVPELDENKFEATATAFFNDIQEKIDLYQYVIVDGELVPAALEDEFSIQYAYFNQSRFKTVGGDLRLKYSIGNFDFNIAGSPIGRYNVLSETTVDVDPFTFVLEGNGEISYQLPKQDLRFSLFVKYNDKLVRFYQDMDEESNMIIGQVTQDGYTQADMTVSKYFWKKRIQVVAGVQNIFDVQDVLVTGFAGGNHTAGVASSVDTGRSYLVNLNWSF